MRFAILAYSCVYPITAYSREEALNRLTAFQAERKVAATLSFSVGKTACNIAHVLKSGEVRKLAAWDDARRPEKAGGPDG